MGPTDKDVLVDVMRPLVPGLYDSLDQAFELAQQHFVEFDMTDPAYQPALHHLARAHSRRLLIEAGAAGRLGDWQVADPGPNVQVLLRNESLELRLLRPLGDEVPPPGPNRARQAYYTNLHDNLLGIRGSRLLGLVVVDPTSGEVLVRVVRPVGTWKFRSRAKIDIDFVLPRSVHTLESLEFIPTEDLEQGFLPFEVEGDEQEGEGDVGRE